MSNTAKQRDTTSDVPCERIFSLGSASEVCAGAVQTVGRNLHEACQIIAECPRFDAWSLDFDLGGDHTTGWYDTGIDFLDWVWANARAKWPVGRVSVHSLDVDGAFFLRQYIERAEQQLTLGPNAE